MVSLMTALWFAHLEAPDRVSVKPHASPVLHAINFLLGRLDPAYLPRLREYGGLQSYPSRTKDPDPVDYSTGSVGIGATATIWGALAHRYVAGHFDVPRGGRQIALLGDAELDEGAVWEAIVDPMVARLGEVLWVVDLNRQSLDRVVPDIAAGRLIGMFEAAGWHTETVKYGRRLRALFERDGGEASARPDRRDGQRGVPAPAARRRRAAARAPARRRAGHRAPHRRPRPAPAARHLPRPRRPRPRGPARRLPRDRRGPRPPVGHLRLHHQGLVAAHRGPPVQPLGAAQPRPVRRPRPAARHRPARAVAPLRSRLARGPAVRRRRGATRARAGRVPPAAAGAGRVGAPAHRGELHAAGARAPVRRPRPRRAGGLRPRGHRRARRRVVDQPRRLDQPQRHLEHRRADRLVRRRLRHARALARVRPRAPRRARHRRGQPRRAARRARCDVEPRRASAAAGGHDLRPVRDARA